MSMLTMENHSAIGNLVLDSAAWKKEILISKLVSFKAESTDNS